MSLTLHSRTPNLTVIDSRGLPIRQVAYLRKVVNGPVETLITRQQHDAAGRLFEQSDPRLFGVVPNLATVYRLSGEPLKVDSVDAGWRLSLAGLAGEALQRWDQRGSHWRTTYDPQLRPLVIEEIDTPNVETFTYADASADPAFNRRGQLTAQLDRSGTLSFDSYSLLGQPLREIRTLAEGKPYRSSRIYGPLGTVLSQTDAGDHQQQSRYDVAGQLRQVQLRIKDGLSWESVLKDAQYNAASQIIEQRAGNDVLSTWTYDPADGRLSMQRAQKNAAPALQNLEYFYDRVGNITRIEDHAFKPIYFANQLIDGHRDFTYDSLYRLTRASGYDDTPPSDVPGRPLPGDPNNRLNYTQHYDYDHGGNLIKLRHLREGASQTREMFIDPGSNRGVRWKEGDPVPDFPELFDRHGNLQDLQPGKALQWTGLDQLDSVTLVKRTNGSDDEEFYRYSQGVRVYKRHETHTPSLTHFQDVIYLPGLEIRTRDNGEELHVITLPGGHGSVRCLHWVSGKPATIASDQLRYSLDDHLGSCALELDQNAQVISEEGYYPFGATAWFARGSEVDVDYKTIRYSGKDSGGVVSGNLRATRTLLALAVIAGVLVLAIVGWPLLAAGRPALPTPLFASAMLYFAIIGFAFMLIQIAFLQRFSVYLGHPTYTFSIILFLMILSAGLGSFASEAIDLARPRGVFWLPVGIAIAVLVETLLLQPIIEMTIGWHLAGRTLVVAALVAPLAFALGYCFPIGLRLVGRHSDRLTAWMWGVNGACGVMASILGVMGSMWLGIHVNLLIAAALYALLALPMRRLAAAR